MIWGYPRFGSLSLWPPHSKIGGDATVRLLQIPLKSAPVSPSYGYLKTTVPPTRGCRPGGALTGRRRARPPPLLRGPRAAAAAAPPPPGSEDAADWSADSIDSPAGARRRRRPAALQCARGAGGACDGCGVPRDRVRTVSP